MVPSFLQFVPINDNSFAILSLMFIVVLYNYKQVYIVINYMDKFEITNNEGE